MQEKQYLEEDEIDLRELFKTIYNKRWFIFIFTMCVSVASLIYVLTRTPIYEAKALIEIGNYKSVNNSINSDITIIDKGNQLSKKLNILFIDMKKKIKDKKSEIIKIVTPKKSDDLFIEIESKAVSNTLAIKEINDVLIYITTKHQIILDDVKKRREFQIDNIEIKINAIRNNEVKLLNEKIMLQEKTINNSKNELEEIEKNLKKIRTINPTLAALLLMEKRNLSNITLKRTNELMDLRNNKDKLLTSTLANLEEEKSLYQSLLLPHNYKNSQIIGEIITSEYPIKPKKKLIVIVSFITGFILSIFIVFFMNFVNSLRKEEPKI